MARRVQCVHCKGITDNVATSPFQCSHCGLPLLVRDHYSRRLAAFQGVNIDAEEPGTAPDPELMKAMIHYIQDFPVALHHPKEEDYLFRKLRERTSAVNPELDELERQHDKDEQMVAELAFAVDEYVTGSKSAPELEKMVANYATFMWEHMGREEGAILPEAQRYLTDADWKEINAAFSENRDPRFGGQTDIEFKHLFSRIVNLANPEAAKQRSN